MANKQQVQIDLLFQAKTDQALQNLNQLGTLLDKITKNTTIGIDNGPMQKAVDSAKMLQTHLQEAMNVKTGKIDLTKLNSSLKSVGTSLGQLSQNLLAIPHTGQKAFLSLAKAIANAEPPAIRLGKKFQDMLTTLGNTAKWKIAQGAINAVSGAMNDAVKYAKDMNKALNDIRIVTQKSTGEMANFAKDAQLAARELSTTSTEYAKAALIFYQQGLDGDEVLKRADTVVKLANVTNQTAQSVSDQMTAIWNNFAEGSTNLEYYADVLTKLGAETAASTDEISQGLEKFAAVAKTIDLSYETATASVATIIDKTKQSADVVGTSLKTIFARMEGLSLGETLEDGVDLNKYSQALKSVGVEILDVNGDIKSMDDILAATGEKWKMLGDSQKIALAQTVGGMRQYNQFMALMENWEDVQLNVDIAKNSTGELQEQQKIWSESWEAASNRVSEKLNQVYDKFINDETIIKLIDTLGYLVDAIGGVVDAFGGIGPMLLTIGGVFSKQLMPIMSNGFSKIAEGIRHITGSTRREIARTQAELQQQLSEMANNKNLSNVDKAEAVMAEKLVGIKKQYMMQAKYMSEAQKAEMERRIANIETIEAETRALLEEIEVLEQSKKVTRANLSSSLGMEGKENLIEAGKEYAETNHKTKEDIVKTERKSLRQQVQQEYGVEINGQSLKADFNDPTRVTERIKIEEENLATAKQNLLQASTGEDVQAAEEAIAAAEKELQINNKILETIRNVNAEYEKRSQWNTTVFAETSIDDEKSKALGAGTLSPNDYAGATSAALGVLEEKEGISNIMSNTGTGEQTNIVVETSIENYTKLKTVQGEVQAEGEALNAMLQEMGQYLEQYKKASKKANDPKASKKERKQAEKEQQEAIKGAKKVEKALNGTYKGYIKNEKAQKKLTTSSKKLQGTEEDVVKGMEGLLDVTKDANKANNQTTEILYGVTESMEDQAAVLGVNKDKMREDGEQARELAKAHQEGALGLTNYINKTDEANNKLANMPTTFQNVATGMMQAIGAVQGLYAGFNQLFTILNDDEATGMEKFMGVLTAMMTIIPSLIPMYTLFAKTIDLAKQQIKDETEAIEENTKKEGENTGVKVAGSVQDGVSVVSSELDEKQIKEHSKAVDENTKKETANIATKVMKAAVEKFGVAGVAIGAGLAATALVAVAAVTASHTQKVKEQNEQLKENTAKTAENVANQKELSNTLMSETDSMDTLIHKYKELANSGKDVKDAQQSIIDQTPKVVEAYRNMAEGLKDTIENQEHFQNLINQLEAAGLVGDVVRYEEIENELENNMAQERLEAVEKNQKQIYSNIKDSSDFEDKMTDSNRLQDFKREGYESGQGPTTVLDFNVSDNDAKKYFGDDYNKDWSNKERTNALGEAIFGDMYVSNETSGLGENEMAIELGSSPEEMVENYERLKNILADDEQLDKLGDEYSQTIQKVIQAYDDMNIDKLAEANKAVTEAQTAAAKAEADQVMNITDVNSVEDLQKYRTQVEKKLASERGITDTNSQEYKDLQVEVDKFLASKESISEYYALEKKLNAIGTNWAGKQGETESNEEYKKRVEKQQQKAQEAYNNLPEDLKKFFVDIDFSQFQTEEAWRVEAERLKLLAEQEDIQVKIQAYTEGLEALEKGDWAALANNSELQWGLNNNKTFEEFMNMSKEEQRDYLNQNKLSQEQDLLVKEKAKMQLINDNKDKYTEEQIAAQETAYTLAKRSVEDSQITTAINTQDWSLLADSLEQVGENSTRGREAYEQFLDATSQDLGIDAKEVKDLAKQLPYLANNFDILSDAVKTDTVLQGQLALRIKQTEKGLEDFANAEEDITEGLNSNNLLEYSQAMTTLKNSILEVLGVSDEFEAAGITLGAKFEQWAQNNYNTIKLALTGDDKAMDELWTQVIQDTYHQITGATGEAIVAMNTALSAFRMGVNIGTIQVGDQLTEDYTTGIKQNLTYMIQQCGASSEQVKAYLASIGITANKVITKLEDLNDIVLTYQGIDFTSITGGFDKILDKEKKYVDLVKKSDLVERYKEINDQLDDLADAMDEASKAADRLYGADRVGKMKEVNALLKNEIELNKQKRAEAETYKENDKSNLQKAIGEFGLEFDFDEAGNITNYDEIMSAVWGYQNSEIEKANKGGVNEKEQKHLDDIQEKIDAVTEGLSTYEDSRELIEDLDKEIQDDFYTWQDNNAEMLSYKLEVGLELNEMDMRNTEYQINKLGDDMFSAAEVGALKSSQKDIHLDNLEKYKAQKQALEDAYNAGEISEAAFAEGLKQIQDGMYGELEALQALDDEMMNYYGDTIAKAQDEVDKYTEKIEHSASVLDHYSSLLELVGKGKDYKTMGTVLKGTASVAKNQADVSKAEYEMYKKEAEEKKRLWDEALASGDAAAAELYEKEYEAAITAQNEAQEEMLSNTEAWLEAEKAVIENELNQLAQDLENSLTNGMSFDFVTMQMEHASSLQEEYLTNTNKIYETNKLIAQTQKQIDETTNSVAKRRLKEFADETKHLQNKSKLSNYELQVQQAKYDLLLAEIALEEAQQAKSTVRLQRDSEGNFGYVYTADQNQINNALATQQEKENALYNLGLENANAYYEKYLQTMQEGTNALTELHLAYLNGEFESEEEFQTQKEALVAYYNQKLIDYAEIYGLAIRTHSQVGQDAWAAAFVDDPDSMVNKALDWKTKVDGYCSDAAGSLQKWYDKIIELEGYTNLNNLATEVNDIKTNSEKLATSITTAETGLIATLQKEFDQVDETTDGWADFRKELMGENKDGTGGIYKDFETLIDQISGENGLLKQLADLDATDTTITITTEYKTVGNPEGDKPKVEPQGEGSGDLTVEENPELIVEETHPEVTTEHEAVGQYIMNFNGLSEQRKWTLSEDGANMGWLNDKLYNSGDVHGIKITAVRMDNSGSGYWAKLGSSNEWMWLNNLNLSSTDPSLPNSAWEQIYPFLAAENQSRAYAQNVNQNVELEWLKQDAEKLLNDKTANTLMVHGYLAAQVQTLMNKYDMNLSEFPEHLQSLYKAVSQSSYASLAGYYHDFLGYDTGGYTGEWGPDGKLAVLHEKELILNPDDTSNFLMALGFLDNILSTLDQYSASAQLSGLLSSPAFNMNTQEALEQNVHIEASFPGVQDRNEIEEAFNTLINEAYQYANRK